MANFPKLILTNAGITLQTKVLGGVPLQLTRIGMGDGELNGTPIAALTQLIHQTATVEINQGKIMGANTYQVAGFFSNQDITTGFWWREVGVFAIDPDVGEVLYCYANAGDAGDYIPTAADQRIEKYIYCSITVSNASSVTIEIPASDTFIPMSEKGVPDGVATLDATGKVPGEQIPPLPYDPEGAAQSVYDELYPLIQDAGGFVLMNTALPIEGRNENKLYALIVQNME